MFIEVTRAAAVSALAAGREVAIRESGEIIQLDQLRSKRACRRLLSRYSGWNAYFDKITGQPIEKAIFMIRA